MSDPVSCDTINYMVEIESKHKSEVMSLKNNRHNSSLVKQTLTKIQIDHPV